jgi:hypothetical protein
MKKQSCRLPPQKLLQHIFGLPTTTLDIHRLEYRNDVLQQELRVIGSAQRTLFDASATRLIVQEFEYLQLATYPLPRSGDQFLVATEDLGREFPES